MIKHFTGTQQEKSYINLKNKYKAAYDGIDINSNTSLIHQTSLANNASKLSNSKYFDYDNLVKLPDLKNIQIKNKYLMNKRTSELSMDSLNNALQHGATQINGTKSYYVYDKEGKEIRVNQNGLFHTKTGKLSNSRRNLIVNFAEIFNNSVKLNEAYRNGEHSSIYFSKYIDSLGEVYVARFIVIDGILTQSTESKLYSMSNVKSSIPLTSTNGALNTTFDLSLYKLIQDVNNIHEFKGDLPLNVQKILNNGNIKKSNLYGVKYSLNNHNYLKDLELERNVAQDEVQEAQLIIDGLDEEYLNSSDSYEEKQMLSDVEDKLFNIEDRIEQTKNDINSINSFIDKLALKDAKIDTSRKSISTYITLDPTQENYKMILNKLNELNIPYDDYFKGEDIEDYDNLTIRISNHDVGNYFNFDTGMSEDYDNESIKINVNDLQNKKYSVKNKSSNNITLNKAIPDLKTKVINTSVKMLSYEDGKLQSLLRDAAKEVYNNGNISIELHDVIKDYVIENAGLYDDALDNRSKLIDLLKKSSPIGISKNTEASLYGNLFEINQILPRGINFTKDMSKANSQLDSLWIQLGELLGNNIYKEDIYNQSDQLKLTLDVLNNKQKPQYLYKNEIGEEQMSKMVEDDIKSFVNEINVGIRYKDNILKKSNLKNTSNILNDNIITESLEKFESVSYNTDIKPLLEEGEYIEPDEFIKKPMSKMQERANDQDVQDSITSIALGGLNKGALGKTLDQNGDSIANGNIEVKKAWDYTFKKPLHEAKAKYAKNVRSKLNDVHKVLVKELGIKKKSKESAAIIWCEEEKQLLEQYLLKNDNNIHHIGSTAVSDIMAKNIIDILIEINGESLESVELNLLKQGYIAMSKSENRISMNKGYTNKGFEKKFFIFI